MLTTEQLERISYAIAMGEDRTRGIDGHAYTELTLCGAVVSAELNRRKHGPYSLSEAIASGRPFRRKGRPIWVKPAPFTEEGPQWLHQRGGGDWEPYLVDTATGWLEEANEFNSDDITTTDYELMPEGGGEE